MFAYICSNGHKLISPQPRTNCIGYQDRKPCEGELTAGIVGLDASGNMTAIERRTKKKETSASDNS